MDSRHNQSRNDPVNKKGGGRLKFKAGTTASLPSSTKKKRSVPWEASEPTTVSQIAEEIPGSGRIVSSGVTIHGFETKFKEEISLGDVIILFHPKQLQDEERIVVGILSQRCVSLNEPFSSDVPSTTAYRIRKDSVLLQHAAARAVAEKASGEDEEATASTSEKNRHALVQDEVSRQLQKKLKKSQPMLTYREKTGMWGYKVVTEKVPKNMTAEELLDLRSKKQGRDKYCW